MRISLYFFGDSELGKFFHWAHADQLDFDTRGTDQFREYWYTIGDSHPTRQIARVIFGAVLYVEPASPATFAVLHRGSFYYCEDLPKNVEESALRSGAVEDILIRSSVASADRNSALFHTRGIQMERLVFVSDCCRSLCLVIQTFSEKFVTAVEAHSADAVISRSSDLPDDALRTCHVNGLRKAIADWIATFLSSLRFDPIEDEIRTRRVLGSLLLIVQSNLKRQLRDRLTSNSDIDETADRFINSKMAPGYRLNDGLSLNDTLHRILEAGHQFSRFINRFSQPGVRFNWFQFPASAHPWIDDSQDWECVLCEGGVCVLPDAPNGRVIFGKVKMLVPGYGEPLADEIINIDLTIERGWFEHGHDITARPSPAPTAPSAPTAESVTDDEEL